MDAQKNSKIVIHVKAPNGVEGEVEYDGFLLIGVDIPEAEGENPIAYLQTSTPPEDSGALLYQSLLLIAKALVQQGQTPLLVAIGRSVPQVIEMLEKRFDEQVSASK